MIVFNQFMVTKPGDSLRLTTKSPRFSDTHLTVLI